MTEPHHTSTSPRSLWARLQAWLFGPEPAVALALYRMMWGALMAWESWRYLAHGWIHAYYVRPTFLFKYVGFEWVQPIGGGAGMTVVSVAMIVAGLLVAVGLAYRAASVVFLLAHTYEFLLGAANYLNHAYLISLLALLMILAPAHRTLSLDALLWPRGASNVVPRWPRALIRIQLGIVYTYGAAAKFNVDWMVYHQPIRQWMQGSANRIAETPWLRAVDRARAWMSPQGVPIPRRLHDFVATEGFTVFIAYGGVIFDLLIIPALAWRRTRRVAIVAAVGFHVSNMHLFSIGVFPWLMLAATTLFLEPDWPLRIPKLGPRVQQAVAWLTARSEGVGTAVRWGALWTRLWVGWIVVQLLVPLRHHLYRGEVAWNEAGHYFSWRMKLRSKKGSVRYHLVDAVSGERWTVDPAAALTKRQARKIRGQPELIRQYAAYLVRHHRESEGRVVEVYVEAFTSLNYREPQRFIDPDQEIGHEPARWGGYAWVVPMTWTEPPHPREER